jgi:uncharacterized membrane protein YbhN (UPF0104 family)
MKIARAIGFVLLAVAAIYFIASAWKYASAFPPIEWNGAAAATFVVATFAYMIMYATSGVAWHLWLKAVREPSHPFLALTLLMVSQFAKYVPGSIAHHIARVALGRRHGLSTPGVVVTIGLETSWALTAGVAVAISSLVMAGPALVAGTALPSIPKILTIAAAALLLPSVGIWLMGERRPAFVNRWLGPNQIAHPGLGTMATCLLLYGGNFVISGWILDLLARQLFGAVVSHLLLAVGVYAVAWVVGLVTLVAPGGIGVREAILLAGLTPAYGAGTALGVAVAFRIVSTLGDGLGFLAGFFAEKHLSRK